MQPLVYMWRRTQCPSIIPKCPRIGTATWALSLTRLLAADVESSKTLGEFNYRLKVVFVKGDRVHKNAKVDSSDHIKNLTVAVVMVFLTAAWHLNHLTRSARLRCCTDYFFVLISHSA